MKRQHYLVLAVTLVAAGLLVVGCNNSSDKAPQDTGFMPSPVQAAPATPAEAPAEPAAEPTPDPCEGDASCGKGISGEFVEGWALEVTSTNRHDNNGLVCMTDGFQGPGIGSYPWHVSGTNNPEKPSVELTPFNPDAIVINDWQENECERTVTLQLDATRSEDCKNMGWLMAVVYPSNKTQHTVKREPGEWKVIETGEWGDCPENVGASNNEETCYECQKVTYGRMCSEETRVDYNKREVKCTDPCEDAILQVKVAIDREGRLGYRVNSSQSGVLTIGGRRIEFQAGDTGVVLLGEPECGQVIEWSAQTRCDQLSGSVESQECVQCEDPYAGSLPGEGQARLSFIAKDSDSGMYVWRIQNNTSKSEITVKQGGSVIGTFNVSPGSIGFFTLDYPIAGLSIYDCNGTKLHGTASSNETEKNFCRFPKLPETECQVCEPVTTSRGDGLYCLDGPIGSESAEASWLGIPFSTFVKKVEDVNALSWTSDGYYDVVLVKSGKCDGGIGYRVYTNVTPGQIIYYDGQKDISHVTLFRHDCD